MFFASLSFTAIPFWKIFSGLEEPMREGYSGLTQQKKIFKFKMTLLGICACLSMEHGSVDGLSSAIYPFILIVLLSTMRAAQLTVTG
jgi:hypothetical protein